MLTADYEATTPREAAEYVAEEMRRRGYPVSDGLIEALQGQIERRIDEIAVVRPIDEDRSAVRQLSPPSTVSSNVWAEWPAMRRGAPPMADAPDEGPACRLTITEDEISGFRAVIGPERRFAFVAFLAIWLAGWVIGESVALIWVIVVVLGVPVLLVAWVLGLLPAAFFTLIGRVPPAEKAGYVLGGLAFFLVWIPFWTYAGWMMLRALRWQLDGREIIAIHDDMIEIRREVGTWLRSRRFDLARVGNFRYSPEPSPRSWDWSIKPPASFRAMLRLEGGSIAFDTDDGTEHVGIGLEEGDASLLIAAIRERLRFGKEAVEPWPADV